MFGSFHQLASSREYKDKWNKIQLSINPPVSLMQYITDIVFRYLVKRNFSLVQQLHEETKPMTFEECNALRYVAGTC